MFDVLGLPLHPLVVHAVVVLLPLSAFGLIASVLVASSIRQRLTRGTSPTSCSGHRSARCAAGSQRPERKP